MTHDSEYQVLFASESEDAETISMTESKYNAGSRIATPQRLSPRQERLISILCMIVVITTIANFGLMIVRLRSSHFGEIAVEDLPHPNVEIGLNNL